MTPNPYNTKLAGFLDRTQKAIESNPIAAAGLGMGVYFGGKIGREYNATAAGVTGSLGGMLAGEQLIRKSMQTGDPYKVFGATIIGSMAPVWGAKMTASAFGQPPQHAHKLAAWGLGVEDAMTKVAILGLSEKERTAKQDRHLDEYVQHVSKHTDADPSYIRRWAKGSKAHHVKKETILGPNPGKVYGGVDPKHFAKSVHEGWHRHGKHVHRMRSKKDPGEMSNKEYSRFQRREDADFNHMLKSRRTKQPRNWQSSTGNFTYT